MTRRPKAQAQQRSTAPPTETAMTMILLSVLSLFWSCRFAVFSSFGGGDEGEGDDGGSGEGDAGGSIGVSPGANVGSSTPSTCTPSTNDAFAHVAWGGGGGQAQARA